MKEAKRGVTKPLIRINNTHEHISCQALDALTKSRHLLGSIRCEHNERWQHLSRIRKVL